MTGHQLLQLTAGVGQADRLEPGSELRLDAQGDKTDSYLRASRSGNLTKLSNYLKNKNVDINASNDVS